MSDGEVLAYSGFVTGARVVGNNIGVISAGIVLGSLSIALPTIVTIGITVSSSLIIGEILSLFVLNLYNKYAPKVYEIIDNAKKLMLRSLFMKRLTKEKMKFDDE